MGSEEIGWSGDNVDGFVTMWARFIEEKFFPFCWVSPACLPHFNLYWVTVVAKSKLKLLVLLTSVAKKTLRKTGEKQRILKLNSTLKWIWECFFVSYSTQFLSSPHSRRLNTWTILHREAKLLIDLLTYTSDILPLFCYNRISHLTKVFLVGKHSGHLKHINSLGERLHNHFTKITFGWRCHALFFF